MDPAGVKYTHMVLTTDAGTISRGYFENSMSGTTVTGKGDMVEYIYVDRDVTVKGTSKTHEVNVDGIPITKTTTNFNLTLKEGWNAVRMVVSVTAIVNTTTGKITGTGKETITLANPSLKWVYGNTD